MAGFSSLEFRDWRQFRSVHIDFSQQTTVLTGANGSGKTTILSTLGHHFGWRIHLVSTPLGGKRRGERLWSDIYDTTNLDVVEAPDDRIQVGTIQYDNDTSCRLFTKRRVSANYELEYAGLQAVPGLLIPSHRPATVYQPVPNIPTDPVTVQQHYQQYQQLLLQSFGAGSFRNPGMIQKQSIIALALFGEGNSTVAPNAEYADVFERLQEKLRLVLPRELGFLRLEVRMPEVVLACTSGDFALDAMSGGINALFGIVWQILLFGVGLDSYCVVIDEPENHLHPSMQRVLLPNLAAAFPNVKFVVATHSPFVVSSFADAAIYALFYAENRRVTSSKLQQADVSGTPNRILREILDVDSNLPAWVELKLENILADAAALSPEERADRIMSELSRLGISDSLSEFYLRNDSSKQ
jgi:predicted ATPase